MGILELLAFIQAREKPKSGYTAEQDFDSFRTPFLIFKTQAVNV